MILFSDLLQSKPRKEHVKNKNCLGNNNETHVPLMQPKTGWMSLKLRSVTEAEFGGAEFSVKDSNSRAEELSAHFHYSDQPP